MDAIYDATTSTRVLNACVVFGLTLFELIFKMKQVTLCEYCETYLCFTNILATSG